MLSALIDYYYYVRKLKADVSLMKLIAFLQSLNFTRSRLQHDQGISAPECRAG